MLKKVPSDVQSSVKTHRCALQQAVIALVFDYIFALLLTTKGQSNFFFILRDVQFFPSMYHFCIKQVLYDKQKNPMTTKKKKSIPFFLLLFENCSKYCDSELAHWNGFAPNSFSIIGRRIGVIYLCIKTLGAIV